MQLILTNSWARVGIAEDEDTLPDGLPAGALVVMPRGNRDGFLTAEEFLQIAEGLPGGDKAALIERALDDYHAKLDARAHGGVAAHDFVHAVEEILGKPWIRGMVTKQREVLEDIAQAVGSRMDKLKGATIDQSMRDEIASLFCGVLQKHVPSFPGDAVSVVVDPENPMACSIMIDPEAALQMQETAHHVYEVFLTACQDLKTPE